MAEFACELATLSVAWSLFRSQSADCAHCIHFLYLPSLPEVWSNNADRTCSQLQKNTNISSLWLTSCVSFSLTLPLPVFLSARFLTRCKVCELLPFPSFDIWWFDEFQRDSGRVYGTAESGISSASFKVLHLTMDPSPVFICPTPFPLPPLPCFSTLIYTDFHTFSTLSFLPYWNMFCKYSDESQDYQCTLKHRVHWLSGC